MTFSKPGASVSMYKVGTRQNNKHALVKVDIKLLLFFFFSRVLMSSLIFPHTTRILLHTKPNLNVIFLKKFYKFKFIYYIYYYI